MQFKEIVGHSEVKKRLIATVNEGRISHAQLFLGGEGSGNLPMAIAYAQYIACENKSDNDSCGNCSSCVKFEKLAHPDLHFVFPVATNKSIKKDPVSSKFINEWRELVIEKKGYFTLPDLQEKLATENKQLIIPKDESVEILKTLSLKTYEAEYKTMIIWYPEKFNISSANKLLKILEEPPNKTLFILVAHDSEQIIPTILSRTQLVKVDKIKDADLISVLTDKFNLTENQATSITSFADGNFVTAQKIIEESSAEEFFYSHFTKWMRMGFVADVPGLINFSEESSKLGREKQKQFLSYSLHIFRESLIQNYGDTSLNRVSSNENKFLEKFAPFIHGANCIDIIELFNDAIYHIERNANPKILFLDVSLKLTKLLRVKQPEIS
ncbi:DNA polymerase III subunit delta' [Vicingus serpentipes]|jgi:DNA polymerase III subunit delta'|uniref:DNA polymerase III subunit delta n=1 Tax=Vicingus serpentipes TaxID=1926625 RepID=A0A5C6RR25_9FLAO|nr:DNA polymerase III subunit delta' [Vicingus serpentipes]TXB64703.1 DNA polymerase III subunit delta' [Vicingus serpentipes]